METTHQMLLSGFGGQGLMSLGRFIAYSAMKENKHALYLPSYGAEVRGGLAHCYVKVSTQEILSPLIQNPTIAILLNQLSLNKFEPLLGKGCLLIINTDLIETMPVRKDIKTVALPLNQIAMACNNIKVANTVALGVLLSIKPILKKETVEGAFSEVLQHAILIKQNQEALMRGLQYQQKSFKGEK